MLKIFNLNHEGTLRNSLRDTKNLIDNLQIIIEKLNYQ